MSKVRHVFCAKHVIDDALANILLDQWDVFVGRSMKDEFGTVIAKNLLETRFVCDVDDLGDQSDLHLEVLELALDLINPILAAAKQNQFSTAEAQQLSA